MGNITESRKRIFVINGSASSGSANKNLIEYIKVHSKSDFDFTDCPDLKSLPHFDPELSIEQTPDIACNPDITRIILPGKKEIFLGQPIIYTKAVKQIIGLLRIAASNKNEIKNK